ncbi:MAG: hypothetical protein ACOC1X_00965 [Promethearchaeota archaeon]
MNYIKITGTTTPEELEHVIDRLENVGECEAETKEIPFTAKVIIDDPTDLINIGNAIKEVEAFCANLNVEVGKGGNS